MIAWDLSPKKCLGYLCHIKILKSVAAFALAGCPKLIIEQGLDTRNLRKDSGSVTVLGGKCADISFYVGIHEPISRSRQGLLLYSMYSKRCHKAISNGGGAG